MQMRSFRFLISNLPLVTQSDFLPCLELNLLSTYITKILHIF